MSPLAGLVRKTARWTRWAVGVSGSDRWLDVWSRAGPKYRTRAAVLLAVDMVLFLGLCLFTYWLRTGQFVPFRGQEWFSLLLRSFKVSGPDQISLTDMLMGPISVERTPLQVVILGLVMASLVSVPILVSILYRFPFALPFAAMIAFAAVLPWLGITAVGACALASLRPLRMGFRFGSALLGLAPFALYLWLSMRSTGGPPPGAGPLDHFKLYAPWGLSLMMACFNMAVVLSVASIVGYRPGAIAPVLAVLFAAPVALFATQIGPDELYYSVLEATYGPASPTCFKQEGLVQFIQEQPEAEEAYAKILAVTGDPLEQVQRYWHLNLAATWPLRQKVERLAIADTEQDRMETIRQAEKFIADFPASRRVPAALYLLGRAMDMQLDVVRLRTDGSILFHDDFPSGISSGVWRSLAGSYPTHPLATVAMQKMAIQALRQGKPQEAMDWLQKAAALAEQTAARQRARGAAPSEGWFSLLMPSPSEVKLLNVDLDDVALQARQWLEFVQANCHDQRYGTAPLALLARMNPYSPQYPDNLAWLDGRYPDSVLHDNLQLLAILSRPSVSVRIDELTQHLARFEGQDSIPRATYELGKLLEQDMRFDDALARYGSLQERYSKSVWTELAAQQAALLRAQLRR